MRGGHGREKHLNWLNSYSEACKWASRFDVMHSLRRGGGLAKYSNFFPNEVARGIKQDLLVSDQAAWTATEASEDHSQNNISHSFLSTKKAKNLEAVSRVLSLLLPESLHVFSAAKYTESDHIAPHDDRAYTQVMMDDGQIISCSRDIAVIVYLSENWSREQGGVLVDLEAPPGAQREYVPEFNSAIIFKIPRWHEVTPVCSDQPRLSIFGWFLVPGHKYPLNTGAEAGQQACVAPVLNAKRKRKKDPDYRRREGCQQANMTDPDAGSSARAEAFQGRIGIANAAGHEGHSGRKAPRPLDSVQSQYSRAAGAAVDSGMQGSRGSGDLRRHAGQRGTEKKHKLSSHAAEAQGRHGPSWQPGDGSILRLVLKE